MLNILARASVSRVADPIGALLVRAGITPNAMTVVGTVGTAAAALWFFPRGQLLAGTLVVTAFLMFDLLDGSMARTSGKVTRFGTVLDASCDRIADGVLFACIAWWCFVVANDKVTGAAALICLVSAQVISYIKARAEAVGLRADGGLVERAERFIIALVGTGLHGFGVPYTVPITLWLLVALALITVAQRLYAVYQSARDADADPGVAAAGASEEASTT
jgi:CDP-diacylglycerol---glycerol-3-phosphate 3-phosphatidyltransferase